MNLIVLTKQFGNYTGATVSTIEILKRISKKFDTVEVVTMKAEKVNIPNVKILIISNCFDLIKILKLKKCEKKVYGYSDDHLGFLFSLVNIPYVHTYHGNWPDAKYLNVNMFLKSFVFIPMYALTIRNAKKVVSVSKYMDRNFVKKHSSDSVVIYNGIKKSNFGLISSSKDRENSYNKFIMVGNIDFRKYKEALPIFKILKEKDFKGCIDIYGDLIDKDIISKIKQYDFVNIMGQVERIDYSRYDALLCTSISENLPVSIVEAILNGVYVLSFNIGGIDEVVNKENSGLLFKTDDYRKFAYTIIDFKYKRIPNFEVNRIKNKFNWDNSAISYMKLFNQINGE